MQNNRMKIMIIGVVSFILLLVLFGVTYAFFNYTNTGTENNVVQAGSIYFKSQENDTISLKNVSPITRASATSNTTNTDDLEIAITGNTTYSGGIEYLITATDVTNTVGNKTVPISIMATVSNGVGTSDNSYFDNRGGNSSIYKVLANETLSEDDQLLVGYITSGASGINGTLTIRAFLDYDLIIISDSYILTENDISAGKVVLTTSEWNSLTGNNALSFKVKVEAREGTWVDEPIAVVIPTDASCFTTTVSNNEVTITGYDENTCGTDVVIPSIIDSKVVSSIGEGSFMEKGITSVIFPTDYPLEIGADAFLYNTISSLVVPSNVTTISFSAFRGNPLTNLNLNMYDLSDVATDDYAAFDTIDGVADQVLTTVTINNATIVPDALFSHIHVQNLYLNDNITEIGSYISGFDSPLQSVTLPSHLQTIGADAFYGATNLNLIIPDSVTSIGSEAFYNINSVTFQNKTCSEIQLMDNYGWGENNTYGANNETCY